MGANIRSCGHQGYGEDKGVYQNEEDMNVVTRSLEYKAREGARQMLVVALEEEVNGFLGRGRY